MSLKKKKKTTNTHEHLCVSRRHSHRQPRAFCLASVDPVLADGGVPPCSPAAGDQGLPGIIRHHL